MLDQLNDQKESIAYVHGDAAPVKLRSYKSLKFNLKKLKDRKVIFMIRDPRDTVVSGYYDAKFREKIYTKDLSSFIRNNKFGLKKVLSFHQLCFENEPYVDQSIFLKYEDLKQNTESELRRVIDFLGWRVTQERLLEVIDFASFKNMKKMEQAGDFKGKYAYALSPGNPENPDSFKVRKGRIGGYSSDLNNDDIVYCNRLMENGPNPFYPI